MNQEKKLRKRCLTAIAAYKDAQTGVDAAQVVWIKALLKLEAAEKGLQQYERENSIGVFAAAYD